MFGLKSDKNTQGSIDKANYSKGNVLSKNKAGFNKKIKKIAQIGKDNFLNLFKYKSKMETENKLVDKIKYDKFPKSTILAIVERNESELTILVRPKLPHLIDAILNPDELEERFYRSLEKNKITKEDLAIIQLEMENVKSQVSSDEVSTRIYDLLEVMSDERQVTMKIDTITDKLNQPLEIDSEVQSNTSIKNVISTVPISLNQDESKSLFFELSLLVSELSRKKDISDKLLNDFRDRIIELKNNEEPAVFKFKLDSILEQAHSTLSKQILNKIKIKLDGHIQVEFKEDKTIPIFEGVNVKPLNPMMVTLNMIRYKLFNALNRLKNKFIKFKASFIK